MSREAVRSYLAILHGTMYTFLISTDVVETNHLRKPAPSALSTIDFCSTALRGKGPNSRHDSSFASSDETRGVFFSPANYHRHSSDERIDAHPRVHLIESGTQSSNTIKARP
nr:hypothetical protein B0A51_09530 [Rachicladosporium sp. CCFEE 5018]